MAVAAEAKPYRSDAAIFVHPSALCESDQVGEGTRIWPFTHVLHGAVIGRQCNIGEHAYVEGGARIGDRVTIKNQVMIWKGVTIEDDVFVGPGAIFTNDRYPRSRRALQGSFAEPNPFTPDPSRDRPPSARRVKGEGADERRQSHVAIAADAERRQTRSAAAEDPGRYAREEQWLLPTRVRRGASIGAGAIILPGRTIGRYACIGAGAVVTRDVPDQRLVVGNPARATGYVCICGAPLDEQRNPSGKNDGAARMSCPRCERAFRFQNDTLVIAE